MIFAHMNITSLDLSKIQYTDNQHDDVIGPHTWAVIRDGDATHLAVKLPYGHRLMLVDALAVVP